MATGSSEENNEGQHEDEMISSYSCMTPTSTNKKTTMSRGVTALKCSDTNDIVGEIKKCLMGTTEKEDKMRIKSLEHRVMQLEAMVNVILTNFSTTDDEPAAAAAVGAVSHPSSPLPSPPESPPGSLPVSPDMKPLRRSMSRNSCTFNFPPAVEYRCYSSSYEEALRRRFQKGDSTVIDERTATKSSSFPSSPHQIADEKKEDEKEKSRSGSPPAVEYRSFSSSYEENIRQRVRSESINDAAKNNDDFFIASHDDGKKKSSHAKRDRTSSPHADPQTTLPSPTNNNNSAAANNTAKGNNHSSSSSALPTSSKGDNTALEKPQNSFLRYIKVEMLGEGQLLPKGTTAAAEETDAVMEEFLRVPSRVEALLLFGLVVCLDSYLYVLTFLPLKFIWAICRFLCTIFIPFQKSFRFHRRHLYQVLQVIIIVTVCRCILLPISIGRTYHWIRGQNMLKLYLLIAIVEVFDRLMCSMGQDALDSLYWNTTSRPWHKRTYISLLVVLTYAAVHSLLLFVHIATLNVAMNSADNALLSLLIGGNFAEIKSTVFKKYNKQNLFKITTSDICERFKLALFLMVILLLNVAQGGVTAGMLKEYGYFCAIVFVSEICADAIKHSFITKFNFIKSTVYADYELVLAGDVTGMGHEGVNLDHTHAVVKRLGFSQLPLVCVMLMYLREAVRYGGLQVGREGVWGWNVWATIWCALLLLKIGIGISLGRISRWILERTPMVEDKEGRDKNKKEVQKRQVF